LNEQKSGEFSHNERDLLARRRTKQTVANNALIDEINFLESENERMKVDVRGLDRRVLDERVITCDVTEMNEKLMVRVDALEEKVMRLGEENEAKLRELDHFYHIRHQAITEIKRLNFIRNAITEDLSAIMHHLEAGVLETDLLKEKVRVYQDYVRIGQKRFEEKRNEIRELENDFSRALARQSQLMLNRKRVDVLEKESFRLDRIWVKMAALAITLEQEGEFPVNVHRWMMLKASDPHLYSLIQMRNSLMNEIGCRVAIHSRVQTELNEIKQTMGKLDVKLMRRRQTKHEPSTGLEQRLRNQTRELEAVQEQFDAAIVATEKHKVEAMRETIHRRKRETTANYDAIVSLRVAIQMPPTSPPPQRTRGRKMGGGFAIGEFSPVLTEIQPLDLTRAASDRARSCKPAQIKAPVSGRSQRPKTLTPGNRQRFRVLLSARLPDENL
jgi:hypothetical protein